MCRYAMSTYKEHYVCFECRKTFKRRLLRDVNREKVINKEEELPSKCPECGQLMANMGKDLESPKKKDLTTWSHLKSLYQAGITFHSCGCIGPGYVPKDKTALIKSLKECRLSYISNINLVMKGLRTEEVPKAIKRLNEALDSWQGKLEEIEQHMELVR